MPAEHPERASASEPEEEPAGPESGERPSPGWKGRDGSRRARKRADGPMGELSDPTPGGESAARASTGAHQRVPEDRPDIRAAKLETRVRRWALALLIAVPAVWFLVQKLT
ncbi:hypothetical protein BK826_10330 [Rothia kristinae]|uniref:Uncharacterized protein n=2 Tax=Rothia kristinae TaxID=37923 RepID=A0A1S2MUT5_9MICC|nr:hypothetical protein [Rothia kristinae]OIJ33922.1 hypothetical protein BK826_10330 [Rothia kristinae]